MRLDLYVKLGLKESRFKHYNIIILFVGIRYSTRDSTRDLLSDLNNYA